MLKKLGLILLFLIVLFCTGLYFLTNKILAMVKEFEPYTFERVLEDPAMAEDYGIGSARNPGDYGFNFEEISFKSYLDSLELSAWYINSAPMSNKSIVLVHGRTSNRLKTMKYLELFDNTGLDTLYNFLIIDCRNSGKSPNATTYMGYKFAEDIRGGINYLQKIQSQDTVVIYGFSMGAMAIGTMVDRADLDLGSIVLEKVILDSPLANAMENLRLRSTEMGLPNIIFENIYGKFSDEIGGYGTKLRLSILLAESEFPILIVQSNDDTSTPARFTKQELELLGPKQNIQTWFMDGPQHVDIYAAEQYKQEYEKRISEFIR